MTFTFTGAARERRRAARVTGLVCPLLVLLATASNAWATSSCPNELFRAGAGANLPDCRAYELVSPPDKNGGEVDGGPTFESREAPQQAAANGEAITYGSQTTFPEGDPLSGSLTSQYISRRGANGWHTEAITPEQDFPGGKFNAGPDATDFTLYQGFSENLEYGFLTANDPAPVAGAPAGYYNPYIRDNLTGKYSLLSTVTPPVQEPGATYFAYSLMVEYAGMSADGTHVVFSANDALTPRAVPGETNLYEWNDGKLELINVLPDGEVVAGNHNYSQVMFGVPTWEQGGNWEGSGKVISANGSRAVWSIDRSPDDPQREGSVYVSELTASGARVTRGPVPGRYETASADGSKVFANDGQLLEYEPATEKTNELTPAGAGVIEVLGASEDGAYVYFDATGALAKGASSSQVNIYLWHEGVTSFIAAVGEDDYAVKEDSGGKAGPLSEGYKLLSYGSTRVSPNGRYLAFESSAPLTGYDNEPTDAEACFAVPPTEGVRDNPSGSCAEVFEYSADTGRLTCASCNPRGLPPVGNSIVPGPVHDILHPGGWQSPTVQQRYLLDNGLVFFQSTDDLLAQATNGKLNVYEFKPDGVSGCQLAAGCLAMISTGTSNENAYFVDASASGSDVFFITDQQLVAADGDEAKDLYDARVDGGYSGVVLPPCGGEACRPPITPAAAIYQAPPSATFVGAGNPSQPTTASAKSSKSKKKGKSTVKKSSSKHKKKLKSRKQAVHGSRKGNTSERSGR